MIIRGENIIIKIRKGNFSPVKKKNKFSPLVLLLLVKKVMRFQVYSTYCVFPFCWLLHRSSFPRSPWFTIAIYRTAINTTSILYFFKVLSLHYVHSFITFFFIFQTNFRGHTRKDLCSLHDIGNTIKSVKGSGPLRDRPLQRLQPNK